MTMGNPPFEAADPIEHVDFPRSCWFSGVYMFINGVDVPARHVTRPECKDTSEARQGLTGFFMLTRNVVRDRYDIWVFSRNTCCTKNAYNTS